jgi:hypothetical protein
MMGDPPLKGEIVRSHLFEYEPEVAAKMPLDKICFKLPEVMRALGMTWPELKAELAAGRLTAEGVPDKKGGYTDIAIRGDVLVRWMAENNRTFAIGASKR